MTSRQFLSSLVSAGLLLGSISPVIAGNPPDAAESSGRVIPGEYIVTLHNSEDGGKVAKGLGIIARHVYGDAIHGFAGNIPEGILKKLKNDPRVLSIEPDMEVSIAGPLEKIRELRATRDEQTADIQAQTLPTGINRIDAELSATADIDGLDNGVNADIAIIDTGVQKSHPDLNVYRQVKFTPESSLDDKNGHGTHVAGIAAAKDNGSGVVGVAPGARIWSVKVLGANGSGRMSDIVAGVDYVRQNAASIEVANMSLGCDCVNSALNTAITNAVNAGVVFTVAAGNSARDASTFSPANHSAVIAVSAIADFNGQAGGGAGATCYSDVDDTFANFSNYGSVVDIAAPGVCIYSTWKGSTYSTISGTSMAAPHVAGAAALYIAKNGKPTNATGVGNVKTGLINAATAQSALTGFSGDPDTFAEPLLNVSGF